MRVTKKTTDIAMKKGKIRFLIMAIPKTLEYARLRQMNEGPECDWPERELPTPR